MKKLLSVVLVTVILLVNLVGCKDDNSISATRIMMDTAVTITLYDGDSAILAECFAICESYDQLFSRTNPDSDVSRINNSDGRRIEVSNETTFLLGLANQYSEMTDGIFDVTIEPLSTLWDFKNAKVPENREIADALLKVDYRNLIVEQDFVTALNGAKVDLGAVAKGYIANALKDYLEQSGVKKAIINLGGNVVLIGQDEFNVGLTNPKKTNKQIAKIRVADKAIVTSGNYERCFTSDGKLYHHLINANTGLPENNGVASMSIISDDSTYADLLSTVCFLLGKDEGMKFAREQSCEAICITDDGKIFLTDGLEKKGSTIKFKEK